MNFTESWEFLDSLQFFKIKLGLDSMSAFLDSLDNPQKNLRFVHVGGTNGKGSVAVTLLTVLAGAGYRVGLYTSPHLSSVRERIRINDIFIPEDEFAEAATKIHDILAGRQITYFEFTTAMALIWFARHNVDLVILEVGLGGRLDATNVIIPLVSVITNVSMDHEAYLGNTLAEIAFEKAGIIKPGVPVVSSVGTDPLGCDRAALQVIEQTCARHTAPLYLFGRDFFVDQAADGSLTYWRMKRSGCCRVRETFSGIHCSLHGRYQQNNLGLVLAVLELLENQGFTVDDESQLRSLSEVFWPGRLEYFCMDRALDQRVSCASDDARRFLLDGAHNPGGVESLHTALQEDFDYERLILVWGAMIDKDIAKTLPVIASLADRIILTQPVGERSATAEGLKERLPVHYHDRAECFSAAADAVHQAARIAGSQDLICVAGSLYLVGEVRKMLLGELVQ